MEILDQQSPSKKYFKKVLTNWQFANSIHLIDYISLICRENFFIKKIIELNSKQKVLECAIKFSSGRYLQISRFMVFTRKMASQSKIR